MGETVTSAAHRTAPRRAALPYRYAADTMRWTTLLIDHPWLALLGAAALALLWGSTRSRIALAAAVLWVAYAGWEITVSEDRVDANIRIDLLVIYPVLAVLTVLAVWSGWRTSRRQ
jgi:hypothetical protein